LVRLLAHLQKSPAVSRKASDVADIKSSTLDQGDGGLKNITAVSKSLFSRNTKAIIWGMQTRAVQGMMDFDFVCRRSEPSVSTKLKLTL